MDKKISWMEKIEKKQAQVLSDGSRLQNEESDLNRLHSKDLFYTITSDSDFKLKQVDMPFKEGNLGYHCENYLPSMTKRKHGVPKFEDNQPDSILTWKKREWDDDTQCMHIVLNINSIIIGEELKDSMLVTLKYSKSLGELKVYPRANQGHLGYRLTPRGLTPPFFLYWIQLVQHQHLIYSEPHGSVGTTAPSIHFDRINYGTLILSLFITVVKFTFFNVSKEKRFFINYSINLPKGWSISPEAEDRFASTHMSMDITDGVFQHLISYSLVNHLNSNREGGLLWPSIFMALQSEYCGSGPCTEGVCSITIPPKPGRFSYTLALNSFKEKKRTVFGKFINSSRTNISQELLMASNSDITDGQQGRYGLISESVGTLHVEIQAIHQAAKGEKKS